MSEPTQEQKFYRVITDEEPCKHCFAGHTWTIAWTENGEEVSIGESFGDQDEAQSYCNDMNMAFNAGFAKLRGEAPERTPEPASDYPDQTHVQLPSAARKEGEKMNRPWRPGLIFGIVLGFCIGGGIFGEWQIKDEFHQGYEVGAWQAVVYANCGYGLPPLAFRNAEWDKNLQMDCAEVARINKRVGVDWSPEVQP